MQITKFVQNHDECQTINVSDKRGIFENFRSPPWLHPLYLSTTLTPPKPSYTPLAHPTTPGLDKADIFLPTNMRTYTIAA